MRLGWVLLLSLVFSSQADAQRKKHWRHRPTRTNVPAVLKKKKGSVLAQNKILDAAGIQRVKNRSEVEDFVRTGELIPLPTQLKGIVIDPIPSWEKVVLPETADWINLTSQKVGRKLHHPLIITSGLRDEPKQRALKKELGDEAASPDLSVHLAGAAIDFSMRNLSRGDRNIFIQWLVSQEKNHKIDALIHGSGRMHFHVFILPKPDLRIAKIPIFTAPTINLKIRPIKIDALAP